MLDPIVWNLQVIKTDKDNITLIVDLSIVYIRHQYIIFDVRLRFARVYNIIYRFNFILLENYSITNICFHIDNVYLLNNYVLPL